MFKILLLSIMCVSLVFGAQVMIPAKVGKNCEDNEVYCQVFDACCSKANVIILSNNFIYDFFNTILSKPYKKLYFWDMNWSTFFIKFDRNGFWICILTNDI